MAKIRIKRALANQRSVLGENGDIPLFFPKIPLNLKKKIFGFGENYLSLGLPYIQGWEKLFGTTSNSHISAIFQVFNFF